MTVSTTQVLAVFQGNGSNTVFNWAYNNSVPFNSSTPDAQFQVIYTNASGATTTLNPSTYTLVFTSALPGTLWGIGGTLSYPNVGSPIANGTTLTLQRIFPLQQTTTISNQGDFSPEVIEAALDVLTMQVQQISARTGLFRSTWTTATVYNYADIVIDGANGANTGNYYFCAIANTSGTWSTDLSNGDWILMPQAPAAPGSGTVTSVSVSTANGISGTVATATTTPAITLTLGAITPSTVSVSGSSPPANGMYLSATNTLAFSTNSTLALSINASQNATFVGSISATALIPTGTAAPTVGMFLTGAGNIAFSVGSSTIAVLKANSFTLGTLTGVIGPITPILGAAGTGTPSIAIGNWNGGQPELFFVNSTGSTINTHGALSSGAIVGQWDYYGDDGTNYTRCISIRGVVDGAVSTSIVPGRIDYYTMTTGGALTKAFTIDSSQNITAQAGNYKIGTIGFGFYQKQGSNGKCGTFTITGTTIVSVSNISIVTSDCISFSLNTVGGTVGAHPTIQTITPGTGFTVAGSVGDTSIYNYSIISNNP